MSMNSLKIMADNKKSGRPESFNARYFSHEVHESDELKVMYRKFKYEGYTAYFRLYECVSKANLHRVELKNDTQKDIFLMNMDVGQEVIDLLLNLLLQTGKMNSEQWEKNQTIYLDEFVKQFKYLWYKRNKKVPNANGDYQVHKKKKTSNKEINTVSDVGKGNNRLEYNKIKYDKIKEESKDDISLSLSEFKEKYPHLKDVSKSLNKYTSFTKKPTKEGASRWLDREKDIKQPEFKKSKNGFYIAYCSKCGNKDFPNDNFQLKNGSSCCHVEYQNKRPVVFENVGTQSNNNESKATNDIK